MQAPKMQNNPLLNQISFDLVKDKVIADKMKEYQEDQQKANEAAIVKGGEKKINVSIENKRYFFLRMMIKK